MYRLETSPFCALSKLKIKDKKNKKEVTIFILNSNLYDWPTTSAMFNLIILNDDLYPRIFDTDIPPDRETTIKEPMTKNGGRERGPGAGCWKVPKSWIIFYANKYIFSQGEVGEIFRSILPLMYLILSLLSQDVVLTSSQRHLNVMDVRWTLKQRCVLTGMQLFMLGRTLSAWVEEILCAILRIQFL